MEWEDFLVHMYKDKLERIDRIFTSAASAKSASEVARAQAQNASFTDPKNAGEWNVTLERFEVPGKRIQTQYRCLQPDGKKCRIHFLFFVRTMFFRLNLGKEIEITIDN